MGYEEVPQLHLTEVIECFKNEWMSECSISEQFEESELEIYTCGTILAHDNITSD